jgi:hypothetical protein
MNKLLLIIILCFSSLFVRGQTLSILYAPTDARMGVRYDKQAKIGYYASASYGNYRYDEFYVEDHQKYSAGVSLYRGDRPGNYTFLSFGLSYHDYGRYNITETKALKPVSFDIGAGALIGKFIIGFAFDPNKLEGEIFTGFKF